MNSHLLNKYLTNRIISQKECLTCHRMKSLNSYYNNGNGYKQSYCKTCCKITSKVEYRRKVDSNEIVRKPRPTTIEAKLKVKASRRRYYLKNRIKILEKYHAKKNITQYTKKTVTTIVVELDEVVVSIDYDSDNSENEFLMESELTSTSMFLFVF